MTGLRHSLCRPFTFLALCILMTTAHGGRAEPAEWVLEGLLTRVDTALAPDLQSGWVLSGSFLLDPLQLQSEPHEGELPRSGRLAGGLSAAELTIDLYHRVLFSARQGEGLAGFDFRENDPDAEGRDLLGWFIPFDAPLASSGWKLTWLQAWLSDSQGAMLRSVPPAVPPTGFLWREAWFRLTFIHVDGRNAHAEGRIDTFAPAAAAGETDASAAWRAVADNLAGQLLQRDSELDQLRADVEAAQARVQSLQRMLDLLVEERQRLQAEQERLAAQAALVDPASVAAAEETAAENLILRSETERLGKANADLNLQLERSRQVREELEQRLAVLQMAILEEPAPEAPGQAEPLMDGSAVQPSQPVPTLGALIPVDPPSVPLPFAELRDPSEASVDSTGKGPRFGPRRFR